MTLVEGVESAGNLYCGGCIGGSIEYWPDEILKNIAEAIRLGTGRVVGYPLSPHISGFRDYVESHYKILAVAGLLPFPMKCLEEQGQLIFWDRRRMRGLWAVFEDDEPVMEACH